MIYLYFLWAFFYAIDTVGIRTILNGNAWSELIKYTLNAKIHLWYLPSLIGVYFLLPVLWSLVKYDNGKYLLYVCGMWLGFTVIKDTLLTFPLNENLEILINKFDFNLNNYCGYFLLGHVLDKYQHIFTKMKSYLLILAYIGIVIVAAAIDSYRSLLTGTPVSSLMGNFMFPVFLEACIIFLLFLRIPKLPLKDWMFAAIKNISKYTLFVYLFHIFVLEHLKINFGISALSFHPILSVPILSAGIFLICMLIAFIIDHIPYVRNMIM